ncbi:MAG: UbiA family prenyltransferase [Alphaproteobacteria bacterium]
MTALALTGFPRRMGIYLAEMYPVFQRFALAALIYGALAVFAGRVHGAPPGFLTVSGAIAVASIFAMHLIVRLMDELKDKDIDARLFPDRPLPSGRVLESDIVIALLLVIALYVAANLWSGAAVWMALGVLGYALLMFRHFFMPAILNDSLPLTVATHNPLFPLIFVYGFAMFAGENGLVFTALAWGPVTLFILMVWATVLGWEIARKIRAPGREDDYVTYSRLFGRTSAVALAAALQATALAIGIWFWLAYSLPWFYPVMLAGGFALVAWRHVQFLGDPARHETALRPTAEAYIFMVLAAQIFGFVDPGWWEVYR